MPSFEPSTVLKQHQLKHTRQRVRVLEEIAAEKAAVSQPDLEKKLGNEIDRVTLYRILNTYEDKGILHRVLDQQGTANYAICSSSCSVHAHHDEHVHFNCRQCHKIYCLEVNVPSMNLPKGFQTDSFHLTAFGICEACQS